MDLEVKIKEEPAWLEGTTTASLVNLIPDNFIQENFEHVSEVIAVKEEVKLELTEPGLSQENSLEPSEDTKEEILIEEQTDDQLLPYIKEETKSRPEVIYTDHQPSDGGSSSFRCSVCSEVLARKLDLLRHVKRHKENRLLKCKSFTSKGSLTVHIPTHTGEKPYRCNVCGKSFIKRSKLTEQTRTITGENPYSCNVCGKSFTWKGSLTDHMLTHTGEKPYSCNVCGKSFVILKGILTDHMRTYTGAKPYSCNVCGKSFIKRGKLTEHMRSYTGEKPYGCNVCSKSFTTKASLTVHMWPHTGETPCRCNVCGKSFIKRSKLTKHMRIHTGES